MNVLVVEDDALLGDAVRWALDNAQYGAQRVSSAEEGWLALSEHNYDLAIVDIGLPGQNGLEFVSEIRRRGGHLPIIIATARDSEGERQRAFAAGANDYLAKPFTVRDLIERCRAITKTGAPTRAESSTTYCGLTVDFEQRRVVLPVLSRPLTESEWQTLECLTQNAGTIVSRETLSALLGLEPRDVEATVQELRTILGTAITIRYLRGLGYRLSRSAWR